MPTASPGAISRSMPRRMLTGPAAEGTVRRRSRTCTSGWKAGDGGDGIHGGTIWRPRPVAESRRCVACLGAAALCPAAARRRSGCWCWAIRSPPATACRMPTGSRRSSRAALATHGHDVKIVDGAVSGDTIGGRPARGWTGHWATARMPRSSSSAPMTGCAASIRRIRGQPDRNPGHAGGAAHPGAADRDVCAAQSRPRLRARIPGGVRPARRAPGRAVTIRSSWQGVAEVPR